MQNHINIEGEDSVKNAKNKDQNHSSTSNNLFNMLNRISGNKTQFWKPTTIKAPGTIKSVKTENPPSSSSSFMKAMVSSSTQSTKQDGTLSSSSSSDTIGSLNSSFEYKIISPSKSSERGTIISPPTTPSNIRLKKIDDLLKDENVDLTQLRKLAWKGVPDSFRGMIWKLLFEYLPTNKDRRESALEKKRKEYCDCIPKYFDINDNERTDDERGLYKQIQIDVPRTSSSTPLFQSVIVQQCLARILYIWAIRHPASGYVQGINDLLIPFFTVFLTEHVGIDVDVENYNIETVDSYKLSIIEADCYWCLTRLLDGIQDNYTFAQLGIQRACHKLGEIIHRVDSHLFEHLKQQDVLFIQFAFKWINCLLIRELPLQLIIRLWDTYAAELETFGVFHVYVCAALLVKFSDQLRQLEFQDIMLFLKNPPTNNWQTSEIEMMLSQAYMWQTLFEDSPKHLEET